jgi:hypothetical protein|tara:strand:+ start:2021 stop:2269 length:249 start_codon:yes stop_codon:yes gene_type:complete
MSADQHYGQHNSIDRFNPPLKPKDDDWWDNLCKQHGAKNHWEKKEVKKEEGKEEDKEEDKDDLQIEKTKVKKLKNKINKKPR